MYDGATLIGSTTAAANGAWTFTPSSDLAIGSHSINVTDTNAAGTSSAHSANTALTIAQLPTETVSVTNLVDHLSSGVSNSVSNGGSTVDQSPGVQGTMSSALQSGEVLAVYRDGVKVGTATVTGTTWSFQDSGVAVGTHTYQARVENGGAMGGMSNSFTFTEAAKSAGNYEMVPNDNDGWLFKIDISQMGLGSGQMSLVASQNGVLPRTTTPKWDGNYWTFSVLGQGGAFMDFSLTFVSTGGTSTILFSGNGSIFVYDSQWHVMTGGDWVAPVQSMQSLHTTHDESLVVPTDEGQGNTTALTQLNHHIAVGAEGTFGAVRATATRPST